MLWTERGLGGFCLRPRRAEPAWCPSREGLQTSLPMTYPMRGPADLSGPQRAMDAERDSRSSNLLLLYLPSQVQVNYMKKPDKTDVIGES